MGLKKLIHTVRLFRTGQRLWPMIAKRKDTAGELFTRYQHGWPKKSHIK
jgi:hypothetical protein